MQYFTPVILTLIIVALMVMIFSGNKKSKASIRSIIDKAMMGYTVRVVNKVDVGLVLLLGNHTLSNPRLAHRNKVLLEEFLNELAKDHGVDLYSYTKTLTAADVSSLNFKIIDVFL